MLDNVSARIKYQNLDRKSNFLLANDGANANDVLYWNRFLQAYDAADLDQDSWKFTLDFTPVESLDVSFEGTIKDNKYSKMVLGRLSDDRTEVYASVSYGDPQKTIESLEEYGNYDQLHIVSIIASSYGVKQMRRLCPKAHLWMAAEDDELTAKSYIVPGLGDAGDLAYGKKLQE